MKLSHEAFSRARQFIKAEARPLDRVMFEHRFEGTPAKKVVEELERFQNDDGGFGRALEPDLRTPSSSALATGIGLRVLKEIGATAEVSMVARAVAYLIKTFDEGSGVWRVAPEDTNEHPHAPWWHDEDGSLARTFDGYVIVPRAELVGSLYDYHSLVPAAWLEELTEKTVADIETIDALGTGGGDDLVYALRLAETEALPNGYKARLLKRIRSEIPKAVSRDPAEWTTYCIPPLKVAPSPESAVADLLAEALESHLDYLIANQSADGTWDPVWSWGDLYPDAWARARREWRGHLTLETLGSLASYGRIEESRGGDGKRDSRSL